MQLRHMGGGTIGGILRSRATTVPSKPLLLTRQRSYTYSEIDELTDHAARGLAALGCQKGDNVCLMAGNHAEFIVSWFGSARAGLVQVPVNTAYKGEFLAYIIEHCQAAVLILDAGFIAQLQTALPALKNLRHLVFTQDTVPSEAASLGVANCVGWSEFMRLGQAGTDFPKVEPWDLATIMYTSGTTGRSKGVMTPHLHNLTQGLEASHALRITSNDVLYTCMPLFHGNAQWATVANALNAGATIALGERFSASRFWAEIREFGATEFNAIGSMLYMLYAQPPSAQDREHQVRVVFAAPAPIEIFYKFEHRFGVRLLEGFGLTETKNIAYNPYDARRPGSFGKPTPTSIITILDPNGEELPPGIVGEIAFRPKSPNILCRGYFRDPEATLRAMSDLWWHTGDLGFRDEDGYFYFVDRQKDAVRRRGENISSYEVERVVLVHPAVLDAAAIAIPSDVIEDDLMIVVILRDGRTLDPKDLFEHCDRNMPSFMVPRYIRFVSELPRTPNDKIRKVELRSVGVTSDTWDSVAAGLKPTRLERVAG